MILEENVTNKRKQQITIQADAKLYLELNVQPDARLQQKLYTKLHIRTNKYNPVLENNPCKYYYEINIFTDKTMPVNIPDIVFHPEADKITYLIDIAIFKYKKHLKQICREDV